MPKLHPAALFLSGKMNGVNNPVINPYQSPSNLDPPEATPLSGRLEGLQRVQGGVRLIYFGVLAYVLAMVAVPILAMFAYWTQSGPLGIAVPMTIGLGFIGGAIAILIGQILSLAVPVESGARGWVIGSVCTQAVGFLMMFGTTLLIMLGLDPSSLFVTVGTTRMGVVALTGLICAALYLIFLRRVNQFIGAHSLADSSKTVLYLLIATSVGYFALGLTVTTGLAEGRLPLGVVALPIGILGLVTVIRYANLLNFTAKALARLSPPSDA